MTLAEPLPRVQARVNALAVSIDAPPIYLPTFGRSEDGARPHIESAGTSYSYVVVERGIELRRDTTGELDELLYWTFRDVTFSMAVDFEVRHRVEGQDFRIILFRRQLELLGELKPHWERRYRSEKRARLEELGLAQAAKRYRSMAFGEEGRPSAASMGAGRQSR